MLIQTFEKVFFRARRIQFKRIIVCALIFAALAHETLDPMTSAQVRREQLPRSEVVIPSGTELIVVTLRDLYSNTVLVGDAVYFKIDEDVLVNNRIVIAKGTFVEGFVTQAKLSKRFGRSGKLAIQVGSTSTVDEQTIKLRGENDKRGASRVGKTIALGVLVGAVLGPIGGIAGPSQYHGKNARLSAGTKFKVYTDGEKRVSATP